MLPVGRRDAVVVALVVGSVLVFAPPGRLKADVAQTETVQVFPSATSVHASGPLPPGGTASVSLAAAIGAREDAMILVAGRGEVSVTAPRSVGPLLLLLFFAHYVRVGSQLVPDALRPWDGSARAPEQTNQPLWLQLTVPYGTAPGLYTGAVSVSAGGATIDVPLSVQVFDVTLPRPAQADGSLLTSFNVSSQTYADEAGRLAGFTNSTQFESVYRTLFPFLTTERISPASWGYGAPRSPHGYAASTRWWQNSAANMTAEAADGFAAMAIPVSNNRASPADYVAGISPYKPGSWCPYLKAVYAFWEAHGWLDSFPYLYGLDEPGSADSSTVARQAAALHACFPGGKLLITSAPSGANASLWDQGGPDEVDVWAVFASRFYGTYTDPAQAKAGLSNAHEWLTPIDEARARGATIWTYTYAGSRTPGFTATEPLSDSRMLLLWCALEGIGGILYGEGATSYKGDPYDSLPGVGQSVLIYPSTEGPVASARLEEIREGIQDWEVLHMVRQREGAADVRRILGVTGLFSASAAAIELGCSVGCSLKTSTPFAWPEYSRDGSTPARIERSHLEALEEASS
jgi:Domain of unknown function (DUF4091)